jgi:hypothetical protein
MKPIRIVLFVFAVVFAQLTFAKDDYYGNIKLRSIGVGNMPQNERIHNTTLQNNTNLSYMHYYGQRTDDQYHTMPMTHNYTALRVNGGSVPAGSNQPFEGDVVTTGNAMYAFPSTNPKEPGATPIGDALPFMVLLSLGYAFVRSKK